MQNQPHDPMARLLNWAAFPADSSRSFPTVFVMECECCQLLTAPRSDSTAQAGNVQANNVLANNLQANKVLANNLLANNLLANNLQANKVQTISW